MSNKKNKLFSIFSLFVVLIGILFASGGPVIAKNKAPDHKEQTSINQKPVKPGETVRYSINQKTEILGQTALTRYKDWTFTDKLDEHLEYKSARLVNVTSNEEIKDAKAQYDDKSRTVTLKIPDNVVQKMPFAGETYGLEITAKVKSDTPYDYVIKNTGGVSTYGYNQDTNEVENPVKYEKSTIAKKIIKEPGDTDKNDIVDGDKIDESEVKIGDFVRFDLSGKITDKEISTLTIADDMHKAFAYKDKTQIITIDGKDVTDKFNFDVKDNKLSWVSKDNANQYAGKDYHIQFVVKVTNQFDAEKEKELPNTASIETDKDKTESSNVVKVMPKVTKSSIAKKIVEKDGLKDSTNVKIGDKVDFYGIGHVTDQAIKEFTITDKVNSGLTIDMNKLAIKASEGSLSDELKAKIKENSENDGQNSNANSSSANSSEIANAKATKNETENSDSKVDETQKPETDEKDKTDDKDTNIDYNVDISKLGKFEVSKDNTLTWTANKDVAPLMAGMDYRIEIPTTVNGKITGKVLNTLSSATDKDKANSNPVTINIAPNEKAPEVEKELPKTGMKKLSLLEKITALLNFK